MRVVGARLRGREIVSNSNRKKRCVVEKEKIHGILFFFLQTIPSPTKFSNCRVRPPLALSEETVASPVHLIDALVFVHGPGRSALLQCCSGCEVRLTRASSLLTSLLPSSASWFGHRWTVGRISVCGNNLRTDKPFAMDGAVTAGILYLARRIATCLRGWFLVSRFGAICPVGKSPPRRQRHCIRPCSPHDRAGPSQRAASTLGRRSSGCFCFAS
jgi:hypothetical protein